MGFFGRLFGRWPALTRLHDLAEAEGNVKGAHPDRGDHPARFGEANVYFVWTQVTAKTINLGRAVQRILDAEVATSAAWPSEDRVRLAPSIAKLDRDIVKLREMRLLTENTHNFSAIILAIMRHPRVSMRIFAALWQARRTKTDAEAELPDDDVGPPFEDTLAELDLLLLERQKVSMAERDLDANLFGGDAQNEDHFVRLMLRSTRHEIDLNGTVHSLTIEPRLLLHRDGAMQLTIGVHLPTGLETSALIAGSRPSLNYIVKSHIPEPFAGPKGEWQGGDWESERDGGVRIRFIDHEVSASIYDYTELVSGRVLDLIKARPSGEWNCYPIVMAQAGSCCINWADVHQHDLVQVAARSTPRPASKFQFPLGPDFSVESNHVFHLNMASALIVYWRKWSPGIQDLNITLLLEHTMLVYTRLRRLERDVREFRTQRRDVLRTYRTALQLAQEARGATIRWVSARAISRHLLSDLGASDIRGAIDQGLTMLGERAGERTDERTARAANRLAVIGVLVAFIATIPSLPAILNLIEEQHRASPDVTAWSIIQTLAASPILLSMLVLSAVLLYFFLSATVIAIRAVRHLYRLRKRGHSSQLAGYRVTVRDEADEAEAQARRDEMPA